MSTAMETTDPHQADTPKKRRTRKASNYLVLRKLSDGHGQAVATGDIDNAAYELVVSNGTVKGCLKKIMDDKIEGELTIVCVRRKPFISSKQEEMVFENA